MEKKVEGAWLRLVRLAKYARHQGKALYEVDPELVLAIEADRTRGYPERKEGVPLHIESHVGQSDLEPGVLMQWGPMEGIFTPKDALAHALGVIEAAGIAVTDCALWGWALKITEGDREKAAPMIRDIYADLQAARNQNRLPYAEEPTK
jgi:hypothetical protein